MESKVDEKREKQIKEVERYRWVVWLVLASVYVFVTFHRMAAGVVKTDLQDAFNIGSAQFANIGSMYFYAYFIMQIPSGILADKLGPKKTLRMYKEKFQNEPIVFKSGMEVYMLNPSEIIWIETDKQKKKIIVHTVKEDISVHMTLKEIQETLGSQFMQIHRCTIVNKEHIRKIESDGEDMYVIMTGDVKELISKRKEKEVAACCTQS